MLQHDNLIQEPEAKEIKIPNIKDVSNFDSFKVRVLSKEDFKLIQKLLFKLGYAWSDDMRTSSILSDSILPLFIYTDYKALIYFGMPMGMDEQDFTEIGSSRLAVLWRDKKYGITVM